MNPFWLLPSKVTSTDQARMIIGRYQAEVAASVARKTTVEESLAALLAVFNQQYPDFSENFDQLTQAALNVGHEEGTRQGLDAMLNDFRRALPYAIKVELAQEQAPMQIAALAELPKEDFMLLVLAELQKAIAGTVNQYADAASRRSTTVQAPARS